MEQSEKHIKIIQKFQDDYCASEFVRDQANEDMRFIMVPGGTWEGFLEDHYGEKPKMEYDMIVQAVDGFMGEWSANDLMPKFRPDSNDDEADANLIDGIFRGHWRKNGGKDAVKNAVFESAVTGYGAVRMGTKFVSEEDAEDLKQDINFTPIHGAYSSVIWDSNARKIDKSDASCVSVIWEYTREKYEKLWPDRDVTTSHPKDDRREFNWNTQSSIFVIEHYELFEETVRVNVFVNGSGTKVFVDQKDLNEAMPELERDHTFRKVSQRKITKRYVEKSVLNGHEFLEEPRRIIGKMLPIVPIYANHSFVDGQEWYYGLVRKQKDPQRILNMQVSNLAENAATSIKEQPIFSPEQVKGLEKRWSRAHLGKDNYQLANPIYNAQGQLVASGPIGSIKPPQIDPAIQGLIQFTTEHIKLTTGGISQDVEDTDSSGKAILAVQKRVDRQTYSIMDNIASSMRRMGQIFISIGQSIFDDNRTVTSVSQDGSESLVQLNRLTQEDDGRLVETNVLKDKTFEVYAESGPSFESQRRETIELLKEIVQILPDGDPRSDLVISSIIDNVDGVGLESVKEFNRKRMLLNGFVKPITEEEKAQVAQSQQQQSQPDATEQLLMSQAQLNQSESQRNQTDNLKKSAEADKIQAQTAQIIEEIGLNKARILMDALERSQQLQSTQFQQSA